MEFILEFEKIKNFQYYNPNSNFNNFIANIEKK